MIHSVLMYVNYLESLLGEVDSSFYNKYNNPSYTELFKNLEVRLLIEELRVNRLSLERKYNHQYDKCLKVFINKKLKELLKAVTGNSSWQIHWSTEYILLFKAEWEKYGSFRFFNKVHWELLRSMNSVPDYKWSFHMEGEELSLLAKENEQSWLNLFEVSKSANNSGQFQKISDFGLKPSEKYILDMSDAEIKNYLQALINNSKFIEYSSAAEKLLDSFFCVS